VGALAITEVPGDERHEIPVDAGGGEAERASGGGRARRAARGPAQDSNPLQRLIRQRLDEQGWSYGDVAKRGGLPRSTVYTVATNRNLARPPRPVTLNGLAWGLDLPVSAVRAAAAASTGLHYYDDEPGAPEPVSDPERDLLIASIDELTAEDRRHVAALVDSLRKKADGERPGR
jgi:transcriptional regulator with XRE-family HTH domain